MHQIHRRTRIHRDLRRAGRTAANQGTTTPIGNTAGCGGEATGCIVEAAGRGGEWQTRPGRGAASSVASRQKSTAAAPQLSRTRTGAPRAQHASRGRGHRAARRRRIASPYKLPHTDTSRDHQDTRFVSPELAAHHRRFGPISRLRPSESVGSRILPGLEFSGPRAGSAALEAA